MTGRIIKAIAGFYYVSVAGSGVYACRAKGIFRQQDLHPCVGDIADIEVTHEADMEANVTNIHERRNLLYRPNAANVDQVLLVFALRYPKPNAGVLDRFLIQMEKTGVETVIVFNKTDLADDEEAKKWVGIYESAGYRCMTCCAALEEGIDEIRALLSGRLTVFAGPSGVGKSSLINLLSGEGHMETGEISRKIRRGKHTTRHSELFFLEEETFLMDTPGFTSLEIFADSVEELAGGYPEFSAYAGNCRFQDCAHIGEQDCGVKLALAQGEISEIRYRNYCQMAEEIRQRRKY